MAASLAAAPPLAKAAAHSPALGIGEHVGCTVLDAGGKTQVVRVVRDHQPVERTTQLTGSPVELTTSSPSAKR